MAKCHIEKKKKFIKLSNLQDLDQIGAIELLLNVCTGAGQLQPIWITLEASKWGTERGRTSLINIQITQAVFEFNTP